MELPIQLFHLARRPNGQMAIIAATATTIYRFNSLEKGPYWSEDAVDYPVGQTAEYVSENPADWPVGQTPQYVMDMEDQGTWVVIGAGFAADAQRWEALNINGWAVFNNGVDLPVTYRVEEPAVVPIYELRELGIASVGCISELNGALLCADISEIRAADLVTLFAEADPYRRFTDQNKINHISYRVINSVPSYPRRWGASSPGSITAGSNVLTMDYAIKSLAYGMKVVVIGAGTNGGNLTTSVQFVNGSSVILLDVAKTTVTNALVEALQDDGAIASGNLVGAYDLQDDGSGIIKMGSLKGAAVVFKDTAIFIGTYIGQAGALFDFRRAVPDTSESVYFRNTLISMNDQALFYAGRNAFYSFDLTTQRPEELPAFELLSNLFFDQASHADQNEIWAAENAVTKEVFFVFPSNTDDRAICYDYVNGTCSTTSMRITAGATIKKPVAGLATGPQEDWFVMGLPDGSVAQYGLTNAPPVPSGAITASQAGNTVTATTAFFEREHVNKSIVFVNGVIVNILEFVSATVVTVGGNSQTVAAQEFKIIPAVYARLNAAYTSILQGGLSAWGDHFREKDISAYVLTIASQSPNCPMLFELLGARNSAEGPAVLGSKTIAEPISANLVPMFFRQNYFQDRITIEGLNNPCRILTRTFKLSGVKSDSFTRRP